MLPCSTPKPDRQEAEVGEWMVEEGLLQLVQRAVLPWSTPRSNHRGVEEGEPAWRGWLSQLVVTCWRAAHQLPAIEGDHHWQELHGIHLAQGSYDVELHGVRLAQGLCGAHLAQESQSVCWELALLTKGVGQL